MLEMKPRGVKPGVAAANPKTNLSATVVIKRFEAVTWPLVPHYTDLTSLLGSGYYSKQ